MKNRHTNNYFFSRMLFFGICTFLFILNSSAQKWTETAKRTVTDFKIAPISDRNSIDRFGHGIAISGDYAISGAYTADHDARGMASKSDAGSAYIYKHTAGTCALGRVVYTVDRVAPHQTIALNHLPTGLYYATISSPSARRVHRIIKQ